jgi:hypothetical protein
MSTTEPTPWIKARASDPNGSCVQLRRNGDAIEVRDSKDPEGPILQFTRAEMAAWIDGAKAAEFDHLL